MSPKTVYTCGTFDLFHLGHLRMIQSAAALGDRLIVGVSTDELVASYKDKTPIVSFVERLEIVRGIKGVDVAIPQTSQDKFEAWQRIGFDIWVVGDDWFDTPKYQGYRKQLSDVGVQSVFLPYTIGVSSTMRRQTIGSSTV